MNKKLTINDIAKEAGVSKSTVSRYLNDGYVRQENRDKIKEIIDKYNYEPNSFAQSLKAKHSKIIGIIAPCLDSTVSSRLMMSMDQHLREAGYFTIITNTNHDDQLELKNIENLANMKVDGLILIATVISEAHKKVLSSLNVPIIVVGQEYASGVCIINDDYHAGYSVGEIIGKRQLRDVIYLGVSESDVAVGKVRKQGVEDGLAKYGIQHMGVFITDFNYEHAFMTIDRILDVRTPSAIICATDKLALGAYKAIIHHGLKIPDDISLIGFGGYELSQLIVPPLTTIRFESELGGELACKTLIDMIEGKEVASKQMIEYKVIEGGSVRSI